MAELPMRALERDLANGVPIILDGATGTEIERRGAAMHDAAWCAMATITHPDILRAVHADYIRAGARVITANTFSSNRNMLAPAGLADQFHTLNQRAVEIAFEARDQAAVAGVVVAGSMSHQVPMLSDSDRRNPHLLPSAAEAERNFHDMATVLEASGVDLILLEKMSDPDLMAPAIEAAKSTGLPVWIGFSVKDNSRGQIRSYSRAELSAAEVFATVDFNGIGAAGVMHSTAQAIGPAIELLREVFHGPLMAYPDSGYFAMPNWQFVDIMPAEELVAFSRIWKASGVQIIGGCCGLGINHIRALCAASGGPLDSVA
jgi:S-methylmethionine-dependent homocysteine/selenocysteine methylase